MGIALRGRRGKLKEIVISKVFVNFRVGDTQDTAVLFDQRLSQAFGPEHVFMSSRSMRGGTVFPPELEKEATTCAAMLVLVGPRWLVPDSDGERRIDEPGDWVRKEIELALWNQRPVIPVLVGDRQRLHESDNLPASIAGLVDHQYLRFHHRSATYDLMHLVDEIRHHVGKGGIELPTPENSVLLTSLRPTRRADVRLAAAEINGRYYGDSIVYRPSVFANHPRGSISFSLGRNYRRLDVIVGVLDDAAEADQLGVFRVIADGAVRNEVAVRQGQPRELSVDVSGVLHLALEAHRPGMTQHPMMAGVNVAGGQSNRLPELAWGNPVLHP
ncbi:TIR domain-containing protein [Actinophytocola gossypii]|uniref:TIR domain-containing protein n=1 Tax=Actinophytocola gossypii TaxID=2812003 RepID=A0ABT2J1I9_9PSEU|nr:TIR domain-containing protein [Actinophytocola gossypii]MCT2581531.1 TIR domain-containing protein [Actinophytocola gossypii]